MIKLTEIRNTEEVLQAIWTDLRQDQTDAGILSFKKRLQECAKAADLNNEKQQNIRLVVFSGYLNF